MDRRALVAGALGLTGIAMIFWPEIDVLSYEDKTIAGIVIMLVATVIASLGNMIAILLYATVVLIWGSTWSAIPYQLGVVAAEVSVGYRYGIASLLLYSFALLSKRQIRIPTDAWPFVLLMGTFLFCLNYILVYYAAAYITSGLVAVLFSSIVLFNALFERFFFKTSMDRRALVAGALGLTGIAMIFWPEIDVLKKNRSSC